MNGHLPAGGRDLGPQSIQVATIRLLPVAAVDVLAGRIDGVVGDTWLRTADPAHGEAWLIPMNRVFVINLIRKLADTADIHITLQPERAAHDD